jgi:protein-disulfide isomerase
MTKNIRENARALREAQALAERRKRNRTRLLMAVGLITIVGLLVAIVVVAILSSRTTTTSNADGPLVTPASATDDGAIAVGEADAPVTVAVYLDYMCPYCGQFEKANGGELDRLIEEGTVRVELHPMSFLDKASGGTRFSTRAANAVATVAHRAPDKVLAVNRALFDRQPAEGSKGLTDAQIAEIATGAGVPQDVVTSFSALTFEPWVVEATQKAFKAGVSNTPTVKINGEDFAGDLYTVGPLTQAIESAKAT